jgi:hypothetical protein
MLKEDRILIENIKEFRGLITENINAKTISDAIKNHEYAVIYYAGDDNNAKGARTIRPFVLGRLLTASKSNPNKGKYVLRAWQDVGNSESLSGLKRIPRFKHEYHQDDDDNQTKPGWRLFFIEKITQFIPRGVKFNDDDGKVLIPTGEYYNENDKQMYGIIAKISAADVKYAADGTDTVNKPDVLTTKIQKSGATSTEIPAYKRPQIKRSWERFAGANALNRRETKNDIENLVNQVKVVWKGSIDNYIIVANKRNELEAIEKKYQDKVPPESVLGNLSHFYSKYFPQNYHKLIQTQQQRREAELRKTLAQKNTVNKPVTNSEPIANKPVTPNQPISKEIINKKDIKEIENPTIERKTFFKT